MVLGQGLPVPIPDDLVAITGAPGRRRDPWYHSLTMPTDDACVAALGDPERRIPDQRPISEHPQIARRARLMNVMRDASRSASVKSRADGSSLITSAAAPPAASSLRERIGDCTVDIRAACPVFDCTVRMNRRCFR